MTRQVLKLEIAFDGIAGSASHVRRSRSFTFRLTRCREECRVCGERGDRDGAAVQFGHQAGWRADQQQAPPRPRQFEGGDPQVPGERARSGHIGGGQVDHDHVAAGGQVADRLAEPAARQPVQRSRRIPSGMAT